MAKQIGRGLRALGGLFGLFNAMDELVRNLPAEIITLAALFDVLLEKYGTAGVGGKGSRSRQEYIAYTVLHRDLATEEPRIGRHLSECVGGLPWGQ